MTQWEASDWAGLLVNITSSPQMNLQMISLKKEAPAANELQIAEKT